MNTLQKTATLRLHGTQVHYILFTFRTVGGEERQMVLRASDSRMPAKVRAALLDANADLTGDQPKVVASVNGLIAEHAPGGGDLVITGGWHGGDHRTFVLLNEVIRPTRTILQIPRPGGCIRGADVPRASPNSEKDHPSGVVACLNFDGSLEANIVGAPALSGDMDGALLQRGTLAAWRETVGKYASYSTRAMFCIGAAFAAPILSMLDRPPFMIMLTGGTTVGKTTATIAAASVIGLGSERSLPDWNMTEARIEELARRHNDLLLPIDDLATMDGSDSDRVRALRRFAHWFSTGARKGRLGRAGTMVTGRPVSSRGSTTIVLTSSEKALADLASSTGMQLEGGVQVRLIEIPATSAGSEGIFDRLPKLKAHVDRTKYARKTADRLRRYAEENQGTVLRAWIQQLLSNPAAAQLELFQADAHFKGLVASELKNAKAARHAEKFAAVFAAGAVAIRHWLLPWSEEQYLDAVLACFRASAAELVDDAAHLEDGLRRLERNLSDPIKIARWPKPGAPPSPLAVSGWRKERAGGSENVVIPSEFRSWFVSRDQQRQVEEHLLAVGAIRRDTVGNLTHRQRIPGFSQRQRCYVIRRAAPSKTSPDS